MVTMMIRLKIAMDALRKIEQQRQGRQNQEAQDVGKKHCVEEIARLPLKL